MVPYQRLILVLCLIHISMVVSIKCQSLFKITVLYSFTYCFIYRELMKLMLFDHCGIFINPSRANPSTVTSITGQSGKPMITQALNGEKLICVTFGFLDDSTHLINPHINDSTGKGTKEIWVVPIVAEWERAISFYGTVLDCPELTIYVHDTGSITFGSKYGLIKQHSTGK